MPWKDRAIASAKTAEYRRLKRLAGCCARCLQPATHGAHCEWHDNYMRIKVRLHARKKAIELRGALRTYGGNWQGDMTPVPGYCATQKARLETWARCRHERKNKIIIEPITEFYPYHTDRDTELIAQVNAAVPRGLPEHIRADVCQDMLASILAGELSIGSLRESVRAYIKAGYRQYGWQWGHMSIDGPISTMDDRPLSEVLHAQSATPLEELLELEEV